MRTVTKTKTVYTFDELSEDAKQVALEKQSEFESQMFDPDCVYEDAANIGDILGIDLRTRKFTRGDGTTGWAPCIYFSGFSSQGDGACFEGNYTYAKRAPKLIRDYAPEDTELHRIADELQKLQRPWFYGLYAKTKQSGYYNHSGCMSVDVDHDWDQSDRALPEEELTQLLRDFADWIYKRLNDEYDYHTGEEACKDSIDANEYEFNEDGSMA